MGVYTTDQYTQVLLHMEETTPGDLEFIDSSGNGNNMTRSGDVFPSSIQTRFGTTSAAFTNQNSGLSGLFRAIPPLPYTGNTFSDYTIDFWFYPNLSSFLGRTCLFTLAKSASAANPYPQIHAWYEQGSIVTVFVNNEVLFATDYGLPYDSMINQWNHFALVHHVGVFRLYINGIFREELSSVSGVPDDCYLTIGRDFSGYGQISPDMTSETFDGYIDEFRLSYNSARWLADFDPYPCYVTVSQGLNGVISPSGSEFPEGLYVAYSRNKIFTLTPDAGYVVDSVIIDGVSHKTSASTYTLFDVRKNYTFSAVFKSNVRIITASAGPNGSISPSGNVSTILGESKTFTIIPNATYAVSSVLVDGLLIGTPSTYTFGNIQTAHTISAAFDNNIRTITASAGLNGSISPSGSVPVTIGQSKTFTFTPDAGYDIEAVTVDGVSQGVINTYTFTNVQAAHTISVTFKLFNSYLITALASTGGTITPSGSVAAIKGSNKTFTIAANTGYQLVDVLVDSVSVGAVLTYTFTNVQAEHTISATFSITTYEIISTSGLHGTITPLGTTTVNSGSNQGYVIAPDEDYIINDVIIDGVSVELPASGTLFITD